MVTRAADVTMATASSVQREPSMEEILASIRRIIEDSDPGRKQPGEGAGAQSEGHAQDEFKQDELRQDLRATPAEKPEAEVEAFRNELRHASPANGKPFTLAEVQAKIAAELPPAPAAENPASRPVSLAEIGAQVTASRDAEHTAPEASDAIVASWRRDIAEAGQTAKAAPAAEARQEPHFDIEPEVEISENELADDAAAAPQVETSPATEPAARLALVSEHTGRQVAAAFEELSEAFASRSKKSFDEMAEEMLRPMLQDWLDNNLPTLVERLVREEIERVARGA